MNPYSNQISMPTTFVGKRWTSWEPIEEWSKDAEYWKQESHIKNTAIPSPAITKENPSFKFKKFTSAWEAETGSESSLSKITSNINYLRVISMGKDAIPFILNELRSDPAPWFVALRAITGEMEVGRNKDGNFKAIAQDWIEWGIRNGY